MMNELEEIRHSSPARGSGLIECVRLTRPRNCVLTGISVWVGAVTSAAPNASFEVALAAIGAAAIAASGNGMNDVIDLEVDRCNRPDRPLPSGRLSAGAALAISATLGVTGLTLAFLAGIIPGMIAFAVVIGLALYNWFLKRTGLAGNVLIGLIAAATFPYGAAAATAVGAHDWGRWWIPALFATLYHVARELVKGVEDAEGDRLAEIPTVAQVRGVRSARRPVAAVLARPRGSGCPVAGTVRHLRRPIPGSRPRTRHPSRGYRAPAVVWTRSRRTPPQPPPAHRHGPRAGGGRPGRVLRPSVANG